MARLVDAAAPSAEIDFDNRAKTAVLASVFTLRRKAKLSVNVTWRRAFSRLMGAALHGIERPDGDLKRFRRSGFDLLNSAKAPAILVSKSFSKRHGKPRQTGNVHSTVSILIEYIVTPHAPLPRGHYAQATKANGLVFVSGQLPLENADGVVIPEGLDAQVHQALSNVREVLLAAGSDVDKLLSVQIYVSDIDNWPRVNELYRAFIGERAPARTVVPCGHLHYGAHVEISAIALSGDVAR